MTATQPRRSYDSTLRRERAARTRENIVTAGAELVRASSIRDWRGVTIRAVAERAGVNERTVYRHFTNERALRDAVMRRLESDSGIELDGMRLEDVAAITARLFRYVSAYSLGERPPLDPTLADAGRRQHAALLAAVAEHTPNWSEDDRRIVAATLDVLWGLASYERLVNDWEFGRDEAIGAITWVIGLVEAAVREGRGPV